MVHSSNIARAEAVARDQQQCLCYGLAAAIFRQFSRQCAAVHAALRCAAVQIAKQLYLTVLSWDRAALWRVLPRDKACDPPHSGINQRSTPARQHGIHRRKAQHVAGRLD